MGSYWNFYLFAILIKSARIVYFKNFEDMIFEHNVIKNLVIACQNNFAHILPINSMSKVLRVSLNSVGTTLRLQWNIIKSRQFNQPLAINQCKISTAWTLLRFSHQSSKKWWRNMRFFHVISGRIFSAFARTWFAFSCTPCSKDYHLAAQTHGSKVNMASLRLATVMRCVSECAHTDW